MFSSLLVGCLFIKSVLFGSRPKVSAGGPSIIMLIHKSCKAVNGALSPNKIDTKTTTTDETLTVS